MGDLTDIEILSRQITDTVVFEKTYTLGHGSFMIAKDMSWFSGDIVNLIKQYATNEFEFLQ